MLAYLLRSMFRWMQRERAFRWVYLTVVLAVAEIAAIGIVWYLPEKLGELANYSSLPVVIRWTMILLGVPVAVFLMGRKHSGARGFATAIFHTLILFIGWFLGKWFGMIFFSLSILSIFYWLADHLAQGILPSNAPESLQERRQKFRYMFWYLWGLQYPIWVANDPGGRNFKMEVDGNFFNSSNGPGIIITLSHQVVGISTGIQFTRVGGPGVIFTKVMERPFAVVDLRTQIRTAEVNAILSNGVSVKTIILASFALDRRDWRRLKYNERHDLYRTTPIFLNNVTTDSTTGSYPYSATRVRAALSKISVQSPNPFEKSSSPLDDKKKTNKPDEKSAKELEKPLLFWDEWVVNQVEQAAKLVLSDRTLDQLWSPKNDDSGANALDEIGNEIKQLIAPSLRSAGIELFTARVVNFGIDENSDVAKQQVTSWKSIWEQREASVLAKAEADSANVVDRARAHSQSMLLETIAKSLKQARTVDQDMPRHLIALHYITALEQVIMQQPGEASEKLRKNIKDWRDYLLMGGTGS